jgi:hypothetical protein
MSPGSGLVSKVIGQVFPSVFETLKNGRWGSRDWTRIRVCEYLTPFHYDGRLQQIFSLHMTILQWHENEKSHIFSSSVQATVCTSVLIPLNAFIPTPIPAPLIHSYLHLHCPVIQPLLLPPSACLLYSLTRSLDPSNMSIYSLLIESPIRMNQNLSIPLNPLIELLISHRCLIDTHVMANHEVGFCASRDD